MKALLISTLACLLVTYAPTVQAQTATLTGTIGHSPSRFALLAQGEMIDTIPINADGTFRFERRLPKPGAYCFMVPRVQVFKSVWLENGKSNALTIDADSPEGVAVTGESERENAYFTLESDIIRNHSVRRCGSFGEYVQDWLNLADSLQRIADSIGNPAFTEYVKQELAAKMENRKHLYGDLLAEWGEQPDSDTDFNAYMESIDLNSLENMQSGKTFYYLKWKARCRPEAPEWDYHAMLNVLSERVTAQAVRDEYGLRLTRMFLTSAKSATAEAEDVYNLAIKTTSPATQERIKAFYINSMRPAGSVVPDFEMLTVNGEKVMFGATCDRNVVFVDVWSTWCGPCCKEIPYVAKLVEHYKDNPYVKFVSISIDKNLNNWRKFLDGHKPQWEQYVVPEQQQEAFLKEFAINGIPRFMVFSNGRKVTNLNAMRPSDAGITRYLDGLLGQSSATD